MPFNYFIKTFQVQYFCIIFYSKTNTERTANADIVNISKHLTYLFFCKNLYKLIFIRNIYAYASVKKEKILKKDKYISEYKYI